MIIIRIVNNSDIYISLVSYMLTLTALKIHLVKSLFFFQEFTEPLRRRGLSKPGTYYFFPLPNSVYGLFICIIGSKKRCCIFTRRSCPALTHIQHTEDKEIKRKKEQMSTLEQRNPYLVNTGKNHISA